MVTRCQTRLLMNSVPPPRRQHGASCEEHAVPHAWLPSWDRLARGVVGVDGGAASEEVLHGRAVELVIERAKESGEDW